MLNNQQLSETVLAALSGDVHSVTALVVQLSSLPGNHTNPVHIRPYRQLIGEVSKTYGGHTAELDDRHVLAIFPAQPPSLALRAALTLRARLDQLSQEAGAGKHPGYRIGIGLHTGSARPVAHLAAGVNEAANLSALNQQAPFPALFVSEETARALPETDGYHVHSLGLVDLPEEPEPLAVFALMG